MDQVGPHSGFRSKQKLWNDPAPTDGLSTNRGSVHNGFRKNKCGAAVEGAG